MRLVKIEHERCGSYDGDVTYIFAPDNKSEDEIHHDIDAAQDEYMDAQEKLSAQHKVPYPALSFTGVNPSLTVAEVLKRHEETKKKYDEAQAVISQNSGSFEDHLVKMGYVRFHDRYDVMVTLSWGHNHGKFYNYGMAPEDTHPGKPKVEEDRGI
jgi:hypothetical protein